MTPHNTTLSILIALCSVFTLSLDDKLLRNESTHKMLWHFSHAWLRQKVRFNSDSHTHTYTYAHICTYVYMRVDRKIDVYTN